MSLSADLELRRDSLTDRLTNTSYRLHPLAAHAIKRLKRGTIFHKWLITMLDEQLSLAELGDIVYFINSLGGLVVEPDFATRLHRVREKATYLLVGLSPPSLISRRAVSPVNLATVIIRTSLGVIFLAGAVATLAGISGLISQANSFIFCVTFIASLWLSTFCHEYSHIWSIKRAGISAAIISSGLRLGIIHRPLNPEQELIAILTGPLAGVLSAGMVTAIIFNLTASPMALFVGLSVAVFHLFSLLPFYGDGRSLKQLLKARRVYGGN